MATTWNEWRPTIDAYYELFSTQWLKRQARPPRILYHYTSAAGLQGILDSERMWATHARFLNDPSELDYGLNLVHEVLAQYRSSGVSEQVERLFSAITGDSKILGDEDAYVICFCAKGDVLSQWRAYGQSGGGYAIGFRSARMKFDIRKGPHFWLWRVIYDGRQQVALLRKALDAAVELVDKQPRHVLADDLFIPNVAGAVRPVLGNYCLAFKSSAFAEEQEWRAIQISRFVNVDLRFRPSGKVLIPYYPVAVGRRLKDDRYELPVEYICFGPTLQPALADRSIRLLIDRYALPHVVVQASGVPLRD